MVRPEVNYNKVISDLHYIKTIAKNRDAEQNTGK